MLSEILLCNKCQSISCNEKLLVGGNYPNLYLGIGSGDLAELALDLVVLSVVKLDSEEVHICANVSSYLGSVLADTARQDRS